MSLSRPLFIMRIVSSFTPSSLGRLYRSLRTGLWTAILFPLSGILFSEWLIFRGATDAAMWLYLLLLFALTLAPLKWTEQLSMLRAFTIIPVFRLVNIGMPVFIEFTLYWFPLVYVPLIAVTLFYERTDPTLNVYLGIRRGLFVLPGAILFGALLGSIEATVIPVQDLMSTWALQYFLVLTVVMVFFVSMGEELLFRGILQGTMRNEFNPIIAIVIASAVNGAMYSSAASIQLIAFGIVAGLVYGFVYELSDSILLVSTIHGTQNVFVFGIIPHLGPFVGL